jgi:hypothetical protein
MFSSATISGDSIFISGGLMDFSSSNHPLNGARCDGGGNDVDGGGNSSNGGGNINLHEWRQNENWKSYNWAVPKISCRYGHAAVSTIHQVFIFGGTYGNVDNTWGRFFRDETGDAKDNRIEFDWPNETFPFDDLDQSKMGIRYGTISNFDY